MSFKSAFNLCKELDGKRKFYYRHILLFCDKSSTGLLKLKILNPIETGKIFKKSKVILENS